FSGFALLGFLIFGAQLNQYSSCMNQATSAAEQQACQTQLDNSITNRIGALGRNCPGPASLVGWFAGPGVDVDAVPARVIGVVDDQRRQRAADPGLRADGAPRAAARGGRAS